MRIPYYHINAFATGPFRGNPAAVCPLPHWLDEAVLQALATEFNLPATAFIVKTKSAYEIRWFDTHSEKTSCGHATLAAAHVLFNEFSTEHHETIKFLNYSKEITVSKFGALISLTAPAIAMRFAAIPKIFNQALNIIVHEAYQTDEQYILITEDAQRIAELNPDFKKLAELDKRAFIVTAPSKKADFVFRYFRPHAASKEDAITGTALYIIAPYWARKLNKTKLIAQQLSSRGNQIPTEINKDQVTIKGQAYSFAHGEIYLA